MLPPALNRLHINLVVLGVGADESDIHDPIGIVDPHHQPVFVSGNVEHHPAILEDAGIAKVLLYLRRGCPVSFESMPIPRQHRFRGIGVARIIFPECPERRYGNDSHSPKFSPMTGLMQSIFLFCGYMV